MRFLKAFALCFAVLLVGLSAVALWVFMQIPSDKEIKGCMVTKMAGVNLCPGSKDYVPLSRISPFLQRAVVMSEDASFWSHKGFDWAELEKSAQLNWQKGSYLRGGSTITQQLAKNLFLSKNKTLTRKGLEALITVRLEELLSKKEILERYLNVVEFGKDIYGIKAAARTYFDKSPADLDAVESAFIAMLLPNPAKYSSSHQKKNLTAFGRKRVRRILGDMVRTGKMSEEEYQAALERMELFLNPQAEAEELKLQEIMDGFESTQELPADAVDGDVHGDPAEEQDESHVQSDTPGETSVQDVPHRRDGMGEGQEPGGVPEPVGELPDGEVDAGDQ